MERQHWCEHLDKICKYTIVNYKHSHQSIPLRILSWYCPECGVHGAHSEILDQICANNKNLHP